MKLAIMQPYLFPYLGYFQLINIVDRFGIGDNVQYINKGWINRNRILNNGKPTMFTFSIKNESHAKVIKDRSYSNNFEYEKKKLLKCISYNYKKAPYYKTTFDLVQLILDNKENNISKFNTNQLQLICDYLNIETLFLRSSLWNIDHSSENKSTQEKAVEKLKKLKSLGVDTFINPIGGISLYNKEFFLKNGFDLSFLSSNDISYKQFGSGFISNLSIIDVMMFNSPKEINKMINSNRLI